MKLGGIDTLYMQNGKWWADRRPVSMVGRRGDLAPPPPPLEENEKKMLSEEILASFTYVLIMKLGGIDTLYIQNGKWWADRRPVSMVGRRGDLAPPPLRNWKKEAVRGNFNLFHIYFTS